jgi:hypothetical protein
MATFIGAPPALAPSGNKSHRISPMQSILFWALVDPLVKSGVVVIEFICLKLLFEYQSEQLKNVHNSVIKTPVLKRNPSSRTVTSQHGMKN